METKWCGPFTVDRERVWQLAFARIAARKGKLRLQQALAEAALDLVKNQPDSVRFQEVVDGVRVSVDLTTDPARIVTFDDEIEDA